MSIPTGPVALWTSAQIQGLNFVDIANLSQANIVGLSATQIGYLSGSQITRLSATQFSLLTSNQVTALSNQIWNNLGALVPQVQALSPSAYATFASIYPPYALLDLFIDAVNVNNNIEPTVAQINAVPGTIWIQMLSLLNSYGGAYVSVVEKKLIDSVAWHDSKMSTWNLPISFWTPEKIQGLNYSDIINLTKINLKNPLSLIQTQALASNLLQIQSVNSISTAQWDFLFSSQPNLLKEYVPLMSAAQVNSFNWFTIGNYKYLQYLTVNQVGALLLAQGSGVLSGSWYTGETNFNVTALAGGMAQQSQSWLNNLTTAQWSNLFNLIPQLPAALMPLMSNAQVNAFNWFTIGNYKYLQYLTVNQVGALLLAQGSGVLSGSWYTGETNFNVTALAGGMVQQSQSWLNNLTTAQWNNLFNLIPQLPAALIPLMSNAQVNAFDWYAIGNYKYLQYLTSIQVGALLTIQGPGVLTGSWGTGKNFIGIVAEWFGMTNFNVTALAGGMTQQSQSWLNNLTTAQWSNLFNLIPQLPAALMPLMSNAQVNAFNWFAVGNYQYLKYLSANQIASQLSAGGAGMLTGSWYTGETNFNVTALAGGIAQQSQSWLNNLTTAQWSNLFNLIPQLPAALIPLMSNAQVNAFNWFALGNYTYLQYLTGPQTAMLLSQQGLGILTGSWNDAYKNFNAIALAYGLSQQANIPPFTAAQWNHLFTSIPQLPAAFVPLMNLNQVRTLDWYAVGNYTYLQYLTANQVGALLAWQGAWQLTNSPYTAGKTYFNVTSLAGGLLQQSQSWLAGITNAQWNDLFTLIPKLPAALVPLMNSAQVNAFNWSAIGNYTYLKYLTENQVKELLTTQGVDILTKSWIMNFNSKALAYGVSQQSTVWLSNVTGAGWGNVIQNETLSKYLFSLLSDTNINSSSVLKNASAKYSNKFASYAVDSGILGGAIVGAVPPLTIWRGSSSENFTLPSNMFYDAQGHSVTLNLKKQLGFSLNEGSVSSNILIPMNNGWTGYAQATIEGYDSITNIFLGSETLNFILKSQWGAMGNQKWETVDAGLGNFTSATTMAGELSNRLSIIKRVISDQYNSDFQFNISFLEGYACDLTLPYQVRIAFSLWATPGMFSKLDGASKDVGLPKTGMIKIADLDAVLKNLPTKEVDAATFLQNAAYNTSANAVSSQNMSAISSDVFTDPLTAEGTPKYSVEQRAAVLNQLIQLKAYLTLANSLGRNDGYQSDGHQSFEQGLINRLGTARMPWMESNTDLWLNDPYLHQDGGVPVYRTLETIIDNHISQITSIPDVLAYEAAMNKASMQQIFESDSAMAIAARNYVLSGNLWADYKKNNPAALTTGAALYNYAGQVRSLQPRGNGDDLIAGFISSGDYVKILKNYQDNIVNAGELSYKIQHGIPFDQAIDEFNADMLGYISVLPASVINSTSSQIYMNCANILTDAATSTNNLTGAALIAALGNADGSINLDQINQLYAELKNINSPLLKTDLGIEIPQPDFVSMMKNTWAALVQNPMAIPTQLALGKFPILINTDWGKWFGTQPLPYRSGLIHMLSGILGGVGLIGSINHTATTPSAANDILTLSSAITSFTFLSSGFLKITAQQTVDPVMLWSEVSPGLAPYAATMKMYNVKGASITSAVNAFGMALSGLGTVILSVDGLKDIDPAQRAFNIANIVDGSFGAVGGTIKALGAVSRFMSYLVQGGQVVIGSAESAVNTALNFMRVASLLGTVGAVVGEVFNVGALILQIAGALYQAIAIDPKIMSQLDALFQGVLPLLKQYGLWDELLATAANPSSLVTASTSSTTSPVLPANLSLSRSFVVNSNNVNSIIVDANVTVSISDMSTTSSLNAVGSQPTTINVSENFGDTVLLQETKGWGSVINTTFGANNSDQKNIIFISTAYSSITVGKGSNLIALNSNFDDSSADYVVSDGGNNVITAQGRLLDVKINGVGNNHIDISNVTVGLVNSAAGSTVIQLNNTSGASAYVTAHDQTVIGNLGSSSLNIDIDYSSVSDLWFEKSGADLKILGGFSSDGLDNSIITVKDYFVSDLTLQTSSHVFIRDFYNMQIQEIDVYGIKNLISVMSAFVAPKESGQALSFSDSARVKNAIATAWHLTTNKQVYISGVDKKNSILTASNSLLDISGLSRSVIYRWESSIDGLNWSLINGENGTRLALTQAQVGKEIRVWVDYTDGFNVNQHLCSDATGLVVNATGLTITGTTGNDLIKGTLNDDTLIGGLGNDTYVFERGAGQDTIIDTDSTTGNADVISVGVTNDQLWFQHVGNDLVISIIGTIDKDVVQSWYVGRQNQIEQIRASNGKVLVNTDVDKLVQAMAALTIPASYGDSTLPGNYLPTLAPVIAANWH